jgi:hypothetical protein
MKRKKLIGIEASVIACAVIIIILAGCIGQAEEEVEETPGVAPGGAISAPAVASWEKNRLDVFVQGNNNHIWTKFFNGQTWSDWQDHGSPPGGAISAPAVASWGPERLDVFVRGNDNHIWTKFFNGQTWSDWQDHGSPPGE